jgi:DNA polymerase (family 10)
MLEQLALLAGIRGDSAERDVSFQAAALLRSRGIETGTQLGKFLERLPPEIEPGVAGRLRYVHESAAWVTLESALADLPSDLRWLFESGAVTLDQLALLQQQLDVLSVADLAAAVAERAVRAIPGLGETVEDAIKRGLPDLRRAVPRIPLGRAVAMSEPLLERLRAAPGVLWASRTGSLRRGGETVGDVEVAAATTQPAAAIEDLLAMPDLTRCLHRSERRLHLLLDSAQVSVRLPEPESAGAILLHSTGSRAHLGQLRARAEAAGWRLTPRGLRRPGGELSPASSEEEVYAALKLPFIAPELRSGADEIQAAENGALPALLTRTDVRGDLHMHTQYSDGRDTVEAMVQASVDLGYDYLAITDHSPHCMASRTLSIDSLARQADEIAALRERHPGIAILHGCEVDIMPDGSLDFPDQVLERLDIVLASLHERAGHSREQLLDRYTAAMRHPLVSIITHPTNRIVPHRAGYDIDYDALFDVAVETGTMVEIDGAPAHLDLDGSLARRAIAAGALLTVDSDCHRASMLGLQMELGVTTARRGWVERRHVVNTRPLDELRALINAKRTG